MLFLYNLITDWEWPWEGPNNYGLYHICWILIIIIATVLLCKTLAARHDHNIDNKVILTFGIILISIELYKQIFYTLKNGYYSWIEFPFQFCSVPMFISFIAPLIKSTKIQDLMYKFLASFGLFAGIVVMLYPEDCFNTPYITILLHTMIWHSSMVIIGIYLIVAKKYTKSIKELVPSIYIFLFIVLVAVVINITTYHLYFKHPELNIHNDSINLLYISPYYKIPFPILKELKEILPYPIYLVLYTVGFSFGSLLINFLIIKMQQLYVKIRN